MGPGEPSVPIGPGLTALGLPQAQMCLANLFQVMDSSGGRYCVNTETNNRDIKTPWLQFAAGGAHRVAVW